MLFLSFLSLLRILLHIMKGEFQFFPPTLSEVYLPSLHPPNLVMSSFWFGHHCVSSVTVHAIHSSLFIFGEPWWLYLPTPHPHPMVSQGLSDFHLGSCLYASPALGCLHTARSGMFPWACASRPHQPPLLPFALSSSWGCTASFLAGAPTDSWRHRRSWFSPSPVTF